MLLPLNPSFPASLAAVDEAPPLFRVAAGVAVLVIWGILAWIFFHRRQVERELEENDAVPRPAPRALLYVVLTAIAVGLSALLLYMAF